ncbi:fimbrial protein [Serratia marcescens]|uniref:fimbrial protein n=1 Tax=Serratia marcescens TaxID=615 RepID=UPI001F156E8D|nr:fimbrial protein [Serratia marcescens]MDP8731086.1 fimbrial protein [Serratia marcescens]
MKRIFFYFSGCVLFISMFNTQASDGNLRLSADVVKPSCSLDSKSLTVPLGDFDLTKLNRIGAASDWVSFDIKFSCVEGTAIYITFDGDEPAPGVYALDKLSDGAQGLGLQISNYYKDDDYYLFYPNKSKYASDYTVLGRLYARYKTYSPPITPGKANATIQFSVTYK